MVITSELVRAARALLRWEQKDLAERSAVSLPSIKRLETQPGPLAAQPRTIDAIRRALEAAGVEFTNNDCQGVRLRMSSNRKTPGSDARVVTPALLLNEAVNLAAQQQSELYQKWIRVSFATGIPHLLLNQADALVDMILRSMENESRDRLHNNVHVADFHLTLQTTLSRYWIYSWYEVIRAAQEKQGKASSEHLLSLRHKVELVRVPLAKLEIANDQKLKQPLHFLKPGDPPEAAKPYSAKQRFDYTATTIMSTENGSCGWRVYDTASKSEVEVLRREISDDILALWS
jgi:transcriptional regulator with XRE-family HTH domain